MQFSKPIQSTLSRLRAALRLHCSTRQLAGCRLRTYLTERDIAAFCMTMQRCSHWHTKPMLSITGSYGGGGSSRAGAAAEARPTTASAAVAAATIRFIARESDKAIIGQQRLEPCVSC